MTDIPTLRLKCMKQARDEGLSGKEQEDRAEALFVFATRSEYIKNHDEHWKEPRSPSFDDIKSDK